MNLRRPSRALLMSMGSIAAFIYLTSLIVVMGSERVYWYWAGFTVSSIFEMAAFYVVPVAVAIWTLALVPARRFHQVVLGGAIFAFVVEGVLTPIIYADGPLPVLASLFVGWHGMLAFVGMWYLTRRWLLMAHTRLLATVGAGFGVLWGLWAFVAALGDADLPESVGAALAPAEFAVYSFGVGIVFVVAHWMIGFVWPSGWKPSRASTWIVASVAAAYFAVAVLLAVPWAPVKLGILLAGTYWLMRRDTGKASTDGPSVIDRLAGRTPFRRTLPILLAPATASISYAAMSMMGLPEMALGSMYWLFVMGQVIGGAVAYFWAARRSLRTGDRSGDSVRVVPSNRSNPVSGVSQSHRLEGPVGE